MRALSTRILALSLTFTSGVYGGRSLGQVVVAAQASLTGTVTDNNGAVVPGAIVTVTSPQTSRTSKTDATGTYSIRSLPDGRYTVSFAVPGFALQQTAVTVSASAALVVNAQLGGAAAPKVAAVVTGQDSGDYVRVSVNDALGPMGYILTPTMPSSTAATPTDAELANASQNFNFPSIILYMSVAPVVYVPPAGAAKSSVNKIQAAQETNRYPQWLDASFVLHPEDGTGTEISGACGDGSIKMIGLLPSQTTGGTATPVAATAAAATNSAASSLSPFYPSVSSEVTAATGALNVLFQDLFPPKPVAYQYANMKGDCEFGWYFRPNTTSGATSGQSILGMQVGIVLLKTTPNIKRIAVSARTLSQWNRRPTTYSKKLYLSDPVDLPALLLPDDNAVDYAHITSLTIFPALIPRAQAVQILHITDAAFDAFVKNHNLVTTDTNNSYVTNSSLNLFLNPK